MVDADTVLMVDDGPRPVLAASVEALVLAVVMVLPAALLFGVIALLAGGWAAVKQVLGLAAVAAVAVLGRGAARSLRAVRRVEVAPGAVRLVRTLGSTEIPVRELYRIAVVSYVEQSRSYPWVSAPTGDVMLRLHGHGRVERVGRWKADAAAVAARLRERLPGTAVVRETAHVGGYDSAVVDDRLPEGGAVLAVLRRRAARPGSAEPPAGYLYAHEAYAVWGGRAPVPEVAARHRVRTRQHSATGTHGTRTWTVYRAVDVQRAADQMAITT